MRRAGRSAFIAGGLVLFIVGVAPAQSGSSGGFTGGGGGMSGSSGGFGGSSGGSGFGSSGSASSFNSSGSFVGSSGGSSRTGSSSTNSVGSTTPFGQFYGNPLYNRLTSNQANAGGKFAITTASFPSSYAIGFGTAQYDAATLARSATRGTTGLGTQNTVNTTAFAGATSSGLRRAPGYITEPVFEMPARPALSTIQTDLQGVLSRATRLPSRDRIQVLTDGETIVLRGQVRDERERRLAEAMIRLSPGVRMVRNELEPEAKPPAK